MGPYLTIRRGMRACNNTRLAYVLEAGPTLKNELGNPIDPALRLLTIRGMGDYDDVAANVLGIMVICKPLKR